MDLIGGYGSDVSDEEPHGTSNGTGSAHNGSVGGPITSADAPVSAQLARLPAPRAADTDRWGSVFGAGILDRKRKAPASASGLSNGTTARGGKDTAVNGLGHEEAAAPRRKLASFMAPLAPLSQEELEARCQRECSVSCVINVRHMFCACAVGLQYRALVIKVLVEGTLTQC